ncbi:MAG: hypothetical protein DRJ10_15595 [Bacteroidetes bacterium]|nr:MAG: hypothetical protein DRJ10_15595 [Bacteroidota bacterium]
MKFFKDHICKEPEVLVELKDRELSFENLINKYRVFLITFLIIGDYVTAYLLGFLTDAHMKFGLPGIALLYFGLYRLHVVTKKKSYKPLIKYGTIVMDYMMVFGSFYEGREMVLSTTGITLQQSLMLVSMFFLIVNSVSALKVQVHVIIFSTAFGILLNTLLHFNNGSQTVVIVYTDAFILISGFFNKYISKFIFNFFVVNHRLSNTLENLEVANEEIKTQNEEIHSQNDELATQNDYLSKQRDEISYQKHEITSSIEYARRIQEAVLDTHDEIKAVVPDSFVTFKPKDIVSGDFYWFKEVALSKKNYKIFTAADSTGHGVPGGFMSMLGISFLNEIIAEFNDEFKAATILNRMRQEVKKQLRQTSNNTEVKDGMDMALCAIDYDKMQVQFAGANNPLYIIRNIDGKLASEIEEIKPDKMPIGVYLRELESFTNHVIDIKKGDLLYTFSDGFYDQFGGETGEKFKKRRFRELLLSVAHLSMKEQKAKIENTLANWMGDEHEQIDDITVIGVRV